MEKYKIKDLLLINDRHVYRFAVLNNKKSKIKIITKDEILTIKDPLDLYVDGETHAQVFAYLTTYGVFAYPVVLKGYEINKVLEETKKNINERRDSFEEINQLSSIMLSEEMIYSTPILTTIFGIDDHFEFENARRNNFIDKSIIEKIEHAINIAESRNTYNIQKENRLAKQIRNNNLYESIYKQTLEF